MAFVICACGVTLNATEVQFYGHSCEACERKFSEAMSAELTRPCKFLEAEGDPVKHRALLMAEMEVQ